MSSKHLRKVSPRPRKKSPARDPSKATIKRNSDTWDANHFSNRRPTVENSWARLVSTNPKYPNANVVKDVVTFGRSDEADIQVTDGAVSNIHCKLWRERAPDEDDDEIIEVWLEDTSTNGTFVDGKRIGKGNKVKVATGADIVLIPHGKNRKKVSYMLYEKREDEAVAPEGNVTFVFTDIQGSTSLWDQAGTSMNVALKRHDKCLRRLLSKYQGFEVKTEGDAFMVAFAKTLDAVAWCVSVQTELMGTKWPADLLELPAAAVEYDDSGRKIFGGIRVRMGVMSGQPQCRRNPVTGRMDYYGPVVNRTARLADSAHGGQIITSTKIKNLIEKRHVQMELDYPDLDFPIRTFTVGTYKYKGLSEPVEVFQIASDSLADRRFPALRSEEVLRATRKQTGGHRFIDQVLDTDDDYGASAYDHVDSELLEPEVCSCPECDNVESLDNPFGACARCKSVKYCSIDCQKAHWKRHKKICKQISAANNMEPNRVPTTVRLN